MPYQGYADGLYLVKQRTEAKGVLVDHYGILDIGNRMNHPEATGAHPLVIHQTPPRIALSWLKDTGNWNIEGKITDEEFAFARIREALKHPGYDLFGNNCEHFARYIATGRRESSQIQACVVAVLGLAALSICVWNVGRK